MITKFEAEETRKKLMKLLPEVKQFNITTEIKNFHYAKVQEVRKLLLNFGEICFIYYPENYSEFINYNRDVENKLPKKKLDHDLKYCITTIENNIISYLSQIDEIIAA